MLRIGGISSGIDTDNIIKDLMKASRMPVDRMLQQRQMIAWQRDAYREMNSKITDYRNNILSDFRLQSTFLSKTTTITGATDAISAKADNSALADSLTIKVDALAVAAAKWSSGDIRDAVDKTFDPLAAIGTQESKLDGSTFTQTNYTININGTDVNINKDVDSLGAIMVRISKETNVSAFYDDITGQISFKSKDTGVINGATKDQPDITFVDDGDFLKNIFNIDTATTANSTAGTNAAVTINGMQTTRTGNTFSVSGIEVTLLKVSSTESTIKVTQDTDKIVDSIKSFIETYNEMLGSLQSKTGEDKYRSFLPLTDEQKSVMGDKEIELWEEKAMSGLLKNDQILNSTIDKLRAAISSQVEVADGEYLTLSNLGINTGSYSERGKLYLTDEAKLRGMIASNPDGVIALFTNPEDSTNPSSQGVASKMYDNLKDSMDSIAQKAGAPFSLANNSFLGKDLTRLDTRIDDANRRLEDLEDRYYRQFTAMEKAMSLLNSQSAYLSSMLGGGEQQ